MSFFDRRSIPQLCRVLAVIALWLTPSMVDAADEKKPLVFGTDVALVQIPVFVSGKDHGAAAGLKASDFTVRQDGKDVDIVSFQYIDTTAPALQEEIRRASAARRRFLLLFDKSFTDPAGLARARTAAKSFVMSGLAASDLVAVATFDFLRGVRLIANFTEDRRVVEHAIHTLGIPSLTRISDPLAFAADFQLTDLTPDRDNGTQQETPGGVVERRHGRTREPGQKRRGPKLQGAGGSAARLLEASGTRAPERAGKKAGGLFFDRVQLQPARRAGQGRPGAHQ